MSDFNPIKAAREELVALNEMEATIRRREQKCELQISEAETELNAVRKILGYVKLQIERARECLQKLEQEH
jgi:hypothetical protein